MKTLDPALADHLAGGVTTLAWCWRLVRRDGTVLGFTDHDKDVSFDATLFEAASGFAASEAREAVGLSAAGVEVTGAVTTTPLSEADFAAGLYDNATVEVYRVNWAAPEQRVLTRRGALGQVQRGGGAFSAEVRGLAHDLQQPKGRLYQHTCDADVGDQRCGLDVAAPPYRLEGLVTAIEGPSRLVAGGLGDLETDWLTRGMLSIGSGPQSGFRVEIKVHEAVAIGAVLTTWQPLPSGLTVGTPIAVTVGCDKLLQTCRDRFANAINFRGFPFMPGNDFVMSYARPGAVPSRGA
jgi:uncharacterized phage protein (TIGR02218 family)